MNSPIESVWVPKKKYDAILIISLAASGALFYATVKEAMGLILGVC